MNTKLSAMQEGGRKLQEILDTTCSFAKAGRSTLEINDFAQKLIDKSGGSASFKMVKGYKFATCIAVNDVVVHGIPKKDVYVKEGDIVGIDIGLFYQGYHTDASWSILIPYTYPNDNQKQDFRQKQEFLAVGKAALYDAITKAVVGNRIGHISNSIQEHIEGAGYSIVKDLIGHGVGKNLHEDPEIPGFVKKNIESTPVLKANMTLAIEIIYTKGKGDIFVDSDGWTIRSKDGTLAGLFEKTIALTKSGSIVLT